jgi:hypothetical protein
MGDWILRIFVTDYRTQMTLIIYDYQLMLLIINLQDILYIDKELYLWEIRSLLKS